MYNSDYIFDNIIKYKQFINHKLDSNLQIHKLSNGIHFGIFSEYTYNDYPTVNLYLYILPSKNLYDLSHFITPWNKEFNIEWYNGNNQVWVNKNIYQIVHNNNNNFINIIKDELNKFNMYNVKLNLVGYSYGGCLSLYLAMYLTNNNIIHQSLIKCIIIDSPQFCSQTLLDKYNNYYFIAGSNIPYLFSIFGYGKYNINYSISNPGYNFIKNHLRTIDNYLEDHS